MNLNNVMNVWNEIGITEKDSIRTYEQVTELCKMRDMCGT